MTRGPDEDDDRTIISTSFGDSDLPQFVSSSSLFNHTLPDGTRLGEFEIRGLIGEGGFGIVYLAYDESLQRQVALKEYMPSSLAARGSTTATVSVKSDRHRETFQAGLKSFINEARLLAQFDHPSLVKVYRFWEGHGTAYMVMPYYEGPTLKHALRETGRAATEAEIKTWLHPLLNALEVMHAAHCFHRDIAPDNILLTATGPLLLDFGAARRVIGDMTHALTVVLKPGYAPIEQYGEAASSMPQGAWTDLYAMASVVYYAITGKAPMSSVDRLMADKLRPLSELGAGQYSVGFLKAMDACLSVRPHERPQSVAELRALLDVSPAAPPAPVAPRPELPDPTTIIKPRIDASAPGHAPAMPPKAPVAQEAPALAAVPKASSSSSRGLLLAMAAGAVLITLAAVAWFTQGRAPAQLGSQDALSSATHPAESSQPAAPTEAPTVAPSTPTAPTVDIAPPAATSTNSSAEPAREPVPDHEAVAPTPSTAAAPPAKPRKDTASLPQKMQPAPPRDAAVHARCGDILQKASLETLDPEETAFLKKECR